MNFFTRMFGREKRSVGVSGAGITYLNAWGGATPRQAENLVTAMACVSVISSALASLPARVYRLDGDDRYEAPGHPVSRLIRAPNPFQTWPDLAESIMGSVLLCGNAICEIEFDGRGRPIGLTFIPWHYVSVVRVPSGRIAYDVTGHIGPWGDQQPPRRLLQDQVWHLKDRSDDGIIGRSRLSRVPQLIHNSIAEQDVVGSVFGNGLMPSGALAVDKTLSDPAWERLNNNLKDRTGTKNAGKFLILENGAKFQPFSISPADAEMLDSRRFTVEELCRCFQVPPPLVQDYSRNTFTNAATAGLWFATFSLSPWARKFECEFGRSIFGPDSNYELEIDLTGLTRGDYAARWESYGIAVQNKILTPAEIRQTEGWSKTPSQTASAGV